MTSSSSFSEFGSYTQSELNTLATRLIERYALLEHEMLQPGEAAGFEPDFFDAVYTMGVRYYESGQHDHSGRVFKMLCTLQPLEARNFKAWGAHFLAVQDYASAVRAYSMAYQVNATDAETSFYLGQAFFLLHEYEESHGHLRFAKEMATRSPDQWPHIAAWCDQLLDRIRKTNTPA